MQRTNQPGERKSERRRSAWRARHGSGRDAGEEHGRTLPLWRESMRARRRRIAVAALCASGLAGLFVFGANGPLRGAAALAESAVVSAEGQSSQSDASSSAAASSGTADTEQQTRAVASLTPTQTALKGISGLDGSAQISTSGFVLGTDLQLQLEQELNIFASDGYSASFVLVDTTTGAALSSYGDAIRYSASAIKGPYVLSLAATGTIDLDGVYQASDDANYWTQQLIEQTITVSDNDAYTSLYETYQSTPLAQWLDGIGVTADMTAGEYLNLSAIDMARMWAQGYGYLFSDETSGEPGSADARTWLASEYADTLNSSIHMALGEQYSVYTKAGWIGGEGGLYALNDAGIVRSSSGDYVLAVMMDASGEYGLLTELITLLDQIHSSVMTS